MHGFYTDIRKSTITILPLLASSSLSLQSSPAAFLETWFKHVINYMYIRKVKKNRDFKPSFWNGLIISTTSISMAVTMAVVRNLADYILQKVKDIIALYTMFSAVYSCRWLDLILELLKIKMSSGGRHKKNIIDLS